ncbi:MAG TPA: hypothetical protein VJX23_00320 [Candidatus Binataceae bacterium]|nr:hypothetical protein [Candidatus Binataceae bacterium]
MTSRTLGSGRIAPWRSVLVATVATVATLWSTAARATITQGDFSVFGFFETREEGRWGEGGSANNGTPTTFTHPTPTTTVADQGIASSKTGGSFDFNHWDLDEARQLGDIRPDYHMVKNYKFLGRFDTLVMKDADFFAFYRPWYDAEGTLKNKGTANANADWFNYSHQQLQQTYFRDDLHEYYAQLNFTDNFSSRVGKQEVIWSEADALSGTEITNSVDSTYHGFIPFESAEDLRKNLRMVKFNYILPDFMKTANNEAEAFIIPGDWEGNGVVANTNDSRSPWAVAAATGAPAASPFTPAAMALANNLVNQNGQPVQARSFLQQDGKEMINLGGFFANKNVIETSRNPSNSLQNSEFGVRLSSLLPVGNGLQASFIYLYEDRNQATGLCTSCAGHGTPLFVGQYFYGAPGSRSLHNTVPRAGVPVVGTLDILLVNRFRRSNYFGLTGTYYDKEFTDIVYRYDTLYTNNQGINVGSAAEWASDARFIVAGDRPTYIPWISKQHTFLTAQYVNTWYPNRPSNSVPSIANTLGKVREDSNFFFVSAVNWVLNGQLTTTNAWVWDVDDNVGDVQSTNVYRYSRNVLLGVNAAWFLGRSGRYSDPFLASVEQRTNELEFTLTYEI